MAGDKMLEPAIAQIVGARMHSEGIVECEDGKLIYQTATGAEYLIEVKAFHLPLGEP